jgi:predicted HAD superfamily Cof-like phosphohydrolase
MKTCKEMVTEFHLLNGSVIDAKSPGPEVAVVRTRLIIEEFAETYAALHQQDVIEAADGLADFLYVIYGTAVAYGVVCPDAFRRPALPPAKMFASVDVLRFSNRILPRLTRACDMTIGPSLDLSAALTSLADETCRLGTALWGMPLRELFEEVHRSNMTKTFSPATNTAGVKYGAGVNPKGPGYSPPDIAGILERTRAAFLKA